MHSVLQSHCTHCSLRCSECLKGVLEVLGELQVGVRGMTECAAHSRSSASSASSTISTTIAISAISTDQCYQCSH